MSEKLTAKLSEIGDKCFLDPRPVPSKLNSHLHYMRLYHATETEESPTSDANIEITVLARNERRALVRETVMRWNAYSRNVDVPSIEEFFEEQGI